MKKSTLITTPLLVSVAGIACAQNDTHPFSVRAGFSYLANKDSRDGTSNSGYTAGISYDLPSKYFGGANAGNRFSIDVDFDSHHGKGNILDSGAAQLAVRSNLTGFGGAGKGGNSPYIGASIGVFQNHVRFTTTPVSGPATTVSDTKTVVGGSVLVGMHFGPQSFVEVAYRISGSVDGAKFDTIDAMIGVHF